ncbi:MAG: cytochrome C peroxidase [Gallionella sp.]|nr:cytochrome C peroxidase [Gallionella sp.]PIR09988.1 MAG: cytochrome C peroxidase [Gallionellaceae bacterium CG11_big_fil_rev_8_21_14_0_20_60_62]
MKYNQLVNTLIASGVLTLSVGGMAIASPCRANPCAPRSARMNPCAAKNPCAVKNPCGAMNPCAANPCAAGMTKMDMTGVMRPKHYKPYKGKNAELVRYGKKLFSDTRLSTNGMSCQTCHADNGAFQATFEQTYPHYVQMTDDRAGVKSVHLDEMVQFCMVAPMASKPLPWNSKKLAALTAYSASLQKGFKANPCAAGNPCAANNPCSAKMNPCAMKKNPCAAKMNPCAGKNPCAAKRW